MSLKSPNSYTADKWREHCEAMEREQPALHEFMETWGRHCGAPRSVFLGHLCKMIEGLRDATGECS